MEENGKFTRRRTWYMIEMARQTNGERIASWEVDLGKGKVRSLPHTIYKLDNLRLKCET